MYQQPNSLVYMQKKQLTWLLAMVFVVVVAAITFSAFLINTLIKGQVANAVGQIRPATVQVVPAASSDDSGCVVPTGGQGGEGAAAASTSSTSAFAGGGTHVLPAVGGSGAGGVGGTVTNSTVTHNVNKSFTKNINSGNTIGSHNGSNNTTTQTNTNNIAVTDSFNGTEENGGYLPQSLNGGGRSGGLTVTNLNVASNEPTTVFEIDKSFDDSGNETSTAISSTDNSVNDSHNRIDHNEIGSPALYPAVE